VEEIRRLRNFERTKRNVERMKKIGGNVCKLLTGYMMERFEVGVGRGTPVLLSGKMGNGFLQT